MTTLWLVGMMGTGKTAAGRMAATSLGVPFWDTDELIETEAGAAVSEIWAEEGEAVFRARESAVIARLVGSRGIVATGGGAVLDPANRAAMTGTIVLLTATPETIASRVDSGGRPLLSGAAVAERVGALAAERSHFYEGVADHVVPTDGLDVPAVADRIARLWPG